MALNGIHAIKASWAGAARCSAREDNEAIRDYTRALKLYPSDAWALKNRGLAWKGLGENGKAEPDWKRALEIEPGVKIPEYLHSQDSLWLVISPPGPVKNIVSTSKVWGVRVRHIFDQKSVSVSDRRKGGTIR
jgi:tetratricopeptide (TPR) repeat protein